MEIMGIRGLKRKKINAKIEIIDLVIKIRSKKKINFWGLWG